MGLDSYFKRASASEEVVDRTIRKLRFSCPKIERRFNEESEEEKRELIRSILWTQPNDREIAYFRKWHCLNQFFDYGDDEYGTDMLVSKEQIERLRDIGAGIVEDGRFDAQKYDLETLRNAMQEILDETDWENDRVYYNADW